MIKFIIVIGTEQRFIYVNKAHVIMYKIINSEDATLCLTGSRAYTVPRFLNSNILAEHKLLNE